MSALEVEEERGTHGRATSTTRNAASAPSAPISRSPGPPGPPQTQIGPGQHHRASNRNVGRRRPQPHLAAHLLHILRPAAAPQATVAMDPAADERLTKAILRQGEIPPSRHLPGGARSFFRWPPSGGGEQGWRSGGYWAAARVPPVSPREDDAGGWGGLG